MPPTALSCGNNNDRDWFKNSCDISRSAFLLLKSGSLSSASLYRASKSSENEFKAKKIKISVVNFFIVLNLDCILQYKCKIRKQKSKEKMLTTKNKNDKFYIKMRPNKSSSLRQNVLFFGMLSLICITFGVGFFIVGAPLILPFAGLEILALIIIIKLNRDWSNQLQILSIDKLHVKITNNKRKKIYDRFLSKFLIQEKNGAKVILLQSHKEQIEIGRFLTADEKDELIAILKRKVHELNFS